MHETSIIATEYIELTKIINAPKEIINTICVTYCILYYCITILTSM